MPLLRRLHLCLGCFFAPMLLFFTVSGLWQMQFWHAPVKTGGHRSETLALLSTLHTQRGLKTEVPGSLSSPALRGFIFLMAASLLLNVALGLVLAFRPAHRRVAAWSLFTGAVLPAALAVHTLWRAAQNLPGP